MGNANSDTDRVFGVERNAQTSTAGNEKISPTNSLSETSELSGVVAAGRDTKPADGYRTRLDHKWFYKNYQVRRSQHSCWQSIVKLTCLATVG